MLLKRDCLLTSTDQLIANERWLKAQLQWFLSSVPEISFQSNISPFLSIQKVFVDSDYTLSVVLEPCQSFILYY